MEDFRLYKNELKNAELRNKATIKRGKNINVLAIGKTFHSHRESS